MARRSDVVFLCLGLNATLEGEEGDAGNSYAGADKPDLDLPAPQMRLMKAVCEVGKPVVLLLASGSALALGYAQEHCAAILQVWYPGQMGGVAVANLIFGHASPSGRLPVTFYETTEELPDFSDYSMKNRTYRYMEKKALYPFGYGLSYGSFRYEDLAVCPAEGGCRLAVTVTNTSGWECDEVTQVYGKALDTPLAPPNPSLMDFARTHFGPGEKKRLEFLLPAASFTVVDQEGERVFDGTGFRIFVGGSQPDDRSAELTGCRPLSLELGREAYQ